jgi:CBS domain-containing protein
MANIEDARGERGPHERPIPSPTRVREVMVEAPMTVNADDDIALALQMMLWRGVRHLPVLRDERLVGVVSERDILAGRLEGESFYSPSSRPVAELMTSPVEVAFPTQEIAEAAAVMATKKLGCLPVLEAGRLVGLLTATDLLSRTAAVPVERETKTEPTVGDVMTSSVVAVFPDERLIDAALKMTRSGVRHLPVVNGLGEVVGMLSDRDLRAAVGDPLHAKVPVGPSPHDPGQARVASAMTSAPRTLTRDDPLSTAVAALLDERFGAFPVVDFDDRLIGIVSYVDVLVALADRAGAAD